MMMFILTIATAVASIASASPVDLSYHQKSVKNNDLNNTNSIWTDCSMSSDSLMIYSINVYPITLQSGKSIYISVSGELKESIKAGGKVSVVLRYANNMNIIRKKYDLCSFVESANLFCPLEAGSITLNYRHTIPSSAPPGLYNGSIVAIAKNGKEISCVSLKLTITA